MTDAATPTTAPLLFNRYRVQEQLGEGRLAGVYGATDERLQRRVLLHLFRKELVGQNQLRERFVTEVNASAQRSHPALLEVFDSGEVGGRPFMVTEYAVGRPLRSVGALTLEQALLYMRQVSGAVAACQARNLPHPMISSSNVLLVDEGRVKLVESWLLPAAEVPLDVATYRPPERTEGQPATPASVVYSLGLLLYELLTGSRAIRGTDPAAVARAHLNTRVPQLSHSRPTLYLPALETLLARATARLPEQRPPDAAAFAEALNELWRTMGRTTQQLAAPPVSQRPFRQGRPNPHRQDTATLPQPALMPRPAAPQPALDEEPRMQPVDRRTVQQRALIRGLVGWVLVVSLLLAVAFGSYLLASDLVRRFANIELPRPTLPDIGGIQIPAWLGGAPAGPAYVINTDALNMRESADINAPVIRAFPRGTRVQQIAGPETVGTIQWVKVRAELDGQAYEGWMSLGLLAPAE
ncbi:MAG: serine/threonine protein kinase [Chloroflexaceae bacterium]|nr:serine/threonine protein kinase [Chloroflexaceae bacterium]